MRLVVDPEPTEADPWSSPETSSVDAAPRAGRIRGGPVLVVLLLLLGLSVLIDLVFAANHVQTLGLIRAALRSGDRTGLAEDELSLGFLLYVLARGALMLAVFPAWLVWVQRAVYWARATQPRSVPYGEGAATLAHFVPGLQLIAPAVVLGHLNRATTHDSGARLRADVGIGVYSFLWLGFWGGLLVPLGIGREHGAAFLDQAFAFERALLVATLLSAGAAAALAHTIVTITRR